MRSRVLYLGLPLGALLLAADGLEIVAACISRPESPGMRRFRKSLGDRVLIKPDLSTVDLPEADQLVSWFWTNRIPRRVIDRAPFAFNVHPSLLPRHRGPDPYFWAIASGDEITGVTAHLLSEQYDEGPILEQRTLAIPEGANAWQLARALDRPSIALMRSIAARHASGEDLASTPQDESRATLAPDPDADDCELRWSEPASNIVRRIRAAGPWPGAFTEFGDRTIVIERARAVARPEGLEPGQAARTREGVIVAAGQDAVLLERARFEEDDGPRAPTELFRGLPLVNVGRIRATD